MVPSILQHEEVQRGLEASQGRSQPSGRQHSPTGPPTVADPSQHAGAGAPRAPEQQRGWSPRSALQPGQALKGVAVGAASAEAVRAAGRDGLLHEQILNLPSAPSLKQSMPEVWGWGGKLA